MKSTTAIFIAIIILTGAFLISGSKSSSEEGTGAKKTAPVQNVSIVDNVQIISLQAKGKYSPKVSNAQAGIPTILRVNTNGTYDCSAAIRVPSLSIAKMLPPNGTTDISLGTPEAGKLRGTCGMGMYNFEINFQ